MDATAIESTTLALTPATPADDVWQLWDRYKAAQQFMRELDKLLHEKLAEWIDANGEPVMNSKRLRIDRPLTTKCLDVKGAIDAIYQAADGDEAALLECLSSNALKPGACRKLLPNEVYQRLFETTRRTKVEEKPARRVAVVDERFVK